MINPLVRYGVATVLCLGITGVFLLCTKYAEQHPYTRIYRTVPLTLTWAMGACSLYLLLQTIFPFLDTPWFDTLGVFLPFGFAILVAIFFLWRRTRYIEDTATLLVLLFALFVFTLINSAGILPHPNSPPPIIAFYATWCAIGSVFLLPCIWFDRWLLRHLGPVLPLPAILQSTWARRRTPLRRLLRPIEISIAGAITATLLAVGLFLHHQLDSFVAALPWTAGLMLGIYLLGTALHWGLRWLFLGKPVYSSSLQPKASSVTVTVEPSDEQLAGWQLYQGPTADGSIPTEVQAQMDAQLQSGRAACIHYRFDNGIQGSQHLPSYCTAQWPQCQTCTCREAAAQLPLAAQGREE